jgi:hypothetical protein
MEQAGKMPEDAIQENATKKPSRWGLYIPFALLGVLTLAWYFYWLFASNIMSEAVTDWIEDERERGNVVALQGYEIRGFPFFLRAEIEAPRYEVPGEFSWMGERLMIDTLPYNPTSLTFSPIGVQKISFASDAGQQEWQLEMETLRMRIAEEKIALQAVNLKAVDASGQRKFTLGDVAINAEMRPEEKQGPVTAFVVASMQGVMVSDGERSVDVTRFDLAGAMRNYPVYEQSGSFALWGGAGGEVIIDGVQLILAGDDETDRSGQSAPMIALHGQIGVDGNAYPKGQINLSLRAPQELLGELVEWQIISRIDANEAAKMLSPMAAAAGGTLSAPITLKDGQAKIFGAVIAELERVE